MTGITVISYGPINSPIIFQSKKGYLLTAVIITGKWYADRIRKTSCFSKKQCFLISHGVVSKNQHRDK